jgi:hypothetical protein
VSQKVIAGDLRFSREHPLGAGLNAGDRFVDRAQADLVPGQFNQDLSAPFEPKSLAKFGR